MSDVICHKHSVNPEDEEWKVALEELTSDDEDKEDIIESFEGQVCPLCFIAVRDRLRKVRRQLKTQSRQNVRLRREKSNLTEIVDVVVEAVKNVTGKDAQKLAQKEYKKHNAQDIGHGETGDLKKILPNLITEAAHGGAKEGK